MAWAAEEEEEHPLAYGIGCPHPHEDHRRRLEPTHNENMTDYHIVLTTDRPNGVRAGKVVGLRVRRVGVCLCVYADL